MRKDFKQLVFDLQSDIEEVRKVAIIWLAQEGDETVLPDLRKMTQDPSTSIRYFARRAIDTIEKRVKGISSPATPAGATGGFQADEWRARLSADDPAARLSSAQALKELDEAKGGPLARERLAAELDPAVKAALVAVLAAYRNDQDLPLLFAQLKEPDPGLRAEAALALEGFYHPSIKEHLLPLVRDPDNRTRANVLLVLGRYDEDLIAAPLAEMAGSSEIWNKDSALFVCRKLRTPRAIELLGRMHAENRGDGYLFPKIDSALRELADKGDEAAAKVLAGLEQGRFERTEGQLELDRVLDDIENEAAPETEAREKRVVKRDPITSPAKFEAAIADDDYERRLSAVDAGVQLDPVAAAMAFRERLKVEQHPFVISKMIKELGRVGGPADIDTIGAQLAHPDARVRANAIEGLAFLGGERIYERIKPLMDDPAPRVQGAAARAVYAIDRDRAFRKLKSMLASREGSVTEAAIHALGDVRADDVLELLEVALGHDEQEQRLKVFRVLQELSAKNPVVAQIYTRYREEGDGVLLREADLAQTMGAAAGNATEARVQAVDVLRRSPDARAHAALEKLSRDRDPRVKRAALTALRVRELELERGVLLYQLGSTLYRAWKRDELENPELIEAFQEVEKVGRELDQGADPVSVLTRRGQAMGEAGRRALDLVNDFAIKHRTRGPRQEKTEDVTVDQLPALAAKIGTIDRKIEERVQSLEEELAMTADAPLPPVHAEKPASGKVAAPRAPVAQGEHGALESRPTDGRIPVLDPQLVSASAAAAVEPPAPRVAPPPPPKAATSSGGTPAVKSGAMPAMKSRANIKQPSAVLTAPVDAALASDGTFAMLRVWLQQNPALTAIGGAIVAVMMLVVIGSSMGGETFHGGWKKPAKDPVRLAVAGDAVLSLSGSGVLTALSLASGKQEWQYAGPSIDNPYPLHVEGPEVVIAGPDGRIVVVSAKTGKKSWEATPGAFAAAPVVSGGHLVALLKEPPTVVVFDLKAGQKVAAKSFGNDVVGAAPLLGGVAVVRKKGLSKMDLALSRSEWEAVLPAETLPDVPPFELGGNIILQCKDLLLCLTKDGSKQWDRRLEPDVRVVPGAPARKELLVVAKRFVEIVDSAGKGGSSATVGHAWSTFEAGKGDVLFGDQDGSVFLLDLRDKTQRKLTDVGEPVRALLRAGNIGVAATAEKVQAFGLAAPRS